MGGGAQFKREKSHLVVHSPTISSTMKLNIQVKTKTRIKLKQKYILSTDYNNYQVANISLWHQLIPLLKSWHTPRYTFKM